MVSLVMLAIMVGGAAALYLKGTLTQGLTLVFNALLASFVACAFFETLATMLTKYAAGMAAWSQMICFLLLFILALAVLQTIAMQIGKEKIDLGLWPERVGRVVCGILLGYIITGNLLLALATAPLPQSLPYARFNERSIDPAKPNKPLLSPDGFIAGLFGTVSKGSFAALSEPKSFAVLHADFVDQLHLNRHKKEVPPMTSKPALSLTEAGVRAAPSTLRDTEGQTLPARSGETLMLVRIGIRKSAIEDAGRFTLSQLRLVCVPKGGTESPLAGQGQTVYPIGFIGAGGRLELKPLHEVITIQSSDVKDKAMDIDFGFYVPTQLVPTLVGFKRNNLERLSAPVAEEDAPEPIPFGGSAKPAKTDSKPDASRTESRRNSRSPASDEGERGSGLSPIGRSLTGDALENN